MLVHALIHGRDVRLNQRSDVRVIRFGRRADAVRNLLDRAVNFAMIPKPLAGRISNEPGAQAFARFVTSPQGQAIIAAYGREQFGRALFTPDAGQGA